MPSKEDIDNVRDIMEKSRKLAQKPEELEELDKIIDGFNDAADRYLNTPTEG